MVFTPYYNAPHDKRILIVDDNPFILKLAKNILRFPGINVTTCEHGNEAYQIACEKHPDVILLDLRLIDTHGNKVLQRIKSNPEIEHIPVAMISSDGDEQHIVQSLAYGAADYIVKPFSAEVLNNKIRVLLERNYKNPECYDYV